MQDVAVLQCPHEDEGLLCIHDGVDRLLCEGRGRILDAVIRIERPALIVSELEVCCDIPRHQKREVRVFLSRGARHVRPVEEVDRVLLIDRVDIAIDRVVRILQNLGADDGATILGEILGDVVHIDYLVGLDSRSGPLHTESLGLQYLGSCGLKAGGYPVVGDDTAVGRERDGRDIASALRVEP